MKKMLLLFSILLVSVLCTACINNLAVQELNDKAKVYLESGNTNAAICRLLSSIDLDGNVFETRYNLAVAYIANEEYKKAEEQLLIGLKIKPDVANAYYSLGVAREGVAFDIINGKEEKKDESLEHKAEEVDINPKEGLGEENVQRIVEKLTEAISAYDRYIALKPDAEDKTEVTVQVEKCKKTLEEYRAKLSSSPMESEDNN